MSQKPAPSHRFLWLLFSFGLGCMFAWFWFSTDRLSVFQSGHWLVPYLVPALMAVLVMPVLGALSDLHYGSGLMGGLCGGLALLLLLSGGFAPLLVIVLLLSMVLHQGLLPVFDPSGVSFLPARGLAICLGVLLGVWLISLAFDLPWRGLLLSASALALIAYSTICWQLNPSVVPAANADIFAEIRSFPRQVGSLVDVVFLLLFMLLFAAGSSQLQCSIWLNHELGNLPLPAQHLLMLFLGAMAAGALSTASITAAYGIRRTLLLTSLLSAFLVLGLYASQLGMEAILMVACAGFLLGVTWGVTFSLCARFVAPSKCGQMAAYSLSAVVLGVALGRFLHLFSVPDSLPLSNSLVFLIALVFALRISSSRAVSMLLPGEVSDNPESPREVEWDWQDGQVSGLGHHNFFSYFSRFLAQSLAEIFFGRLRIEGREHLKLDRGTILVANHPNTFFDPLLITALSSARLHYWAKSTLWKLPMIGSVLDSFGAIPVFRKEDGLAGDGNLRSLDLAAEKLIQDGVLLIFPEGVSEVGLSLKPIKTGAARLGFTTMVARNWVGDLKIIPIGLDYSEPRLFRSGVTVRVGEPVTMGRFRHAWQVSPRAAVVQVTSVLTEALASLLPHLNAPELEVLVLQIQRLYGERLLQILGEDDETSARMAIAEAVNHYHAMDPETLLLFSQRMNMYQRERERLSTPVNHPPIPVSDLLRMLSSLFSLASFGLVSNWIPYRLTGKLVALVTQTPVWVAFAKLMVGGLVFGLYYLLLGFLFLHLVSPLGCFMLLSAIVFSAFVALGAMERFAFRFRQLNSLWQAFWTQDTDENLDEMKVSLIQDLERFRESYAFYKAKE